MNGILSVSSFCEVCSAVSRSISWAQCLPVVLRNDPETKHIFSLPPLISFKRDKNLGNFLVRSAFKLTTNQEPSHANAHDAKLVPLFLTQLRSQDPIDPSKSQTISPAYPQISSIA